MGHYVSHKQRVRLGAKRNSVTMPPEDEVIHVKHGAAKGHEGEVVVHKTASTETRMKKKVV